MSAADAQTLRLIARRTWRFFETFVTAADNMLPPDNFQEDPDPVLAHRTSPTNLGLYLLSVATARDFAWIGTIEAVERLEATLATMGRLARFRGHFYNWYDTRDLRAARSALYLHGRQRQSGRPSDHPGQRLPGVGRTGSRRPSQRLAGIADALDLHARSDGAAARRAANPDRDLAPAR